MIGLLVWLGWLLLIVAVIGLIAFAARRRAFRRGTHPLRLLPWYLGGPPEAPLDPPPSGSARSRRRN